MVASDTGDGALIWSRVEPGFYVGSRGGEFLGYIDRRPDRGYVAFDLHSSELGAFDSRDDAIAAVESQTSRHSSGAEA
ncbi:hypothetical protein [Schumannella sp. 10F1B-5-1]|uniref:hypothetical protein n=1 Tax=Schumannella sp. 10F1B-5-1 TaxID=2590780 RepID=UPI0011315EF7|nr:hypothetical protein [Schumannella sp. 10F1B-5-1]TPW78355.1 hypothetical protein FJ658_00675 [Schumannella sp. 10F1B-5-1]